jgi:serine/threonine-protein kinase
MGVVVAATHIQLEERYALKFMLPRALENAEATGRFLQEARAAAKLKSEHVARVHDVGTLESGAPYIVMEYLEGEDLSRVLLTRGPLRVEEIADYALQTCDAVAEAHARGIVHRDLKPANLFITRGSDGHPLVKVLDFGISKANSLSDSRVSMTKSSVLLGSPLYMSPEQMKSARDVDPATDQWSIGVILYEAVGGRVPYDAGTIGALMAMVLTEVPAPLQSVRSDVPEGFVAIVNRCLEREPSRRYGSVADLARALAPFASPRMQPLADRVASVLRATHSGGARGGPAGAISGLDATVADPSGSGRLGASNSSSGGAVRLQTGGGWGGTASRSSSRRALFAVAALAAVVLLGVAGGVVLWMRARPVATASTATQTAASSPALLAATAPAASVAAPVAGPASAAPSTGVAADAALPATSSVPVHVRPVPRSTPSKPPSTPSTPPNDDAFGNSRK